MYSLRISKFTERSRAGQALHELSAGEVAQAGGSEIYCILGDEFVHFHFDTFRRIIMCIDLIYHFEK